MATSYPAERGHVRGKLRVYLGAAPGVGKTYAMLAEGQRRRARGADVVGALIETHGRQLTAAMAEGTEILPRRTMTYRGATLTEMDMDAMLARHPLVDELAHSNVPGCRNAKRWPDVEELLDAGIDVITTLNIQHLESLSTVARQVTGVVQHETLPDDVARRADQIELVGMTPEALRRRMVPGNIYPPNRAEAALTHYFRPGNLTALRELALLWMADRVGEGMQRYRAEHGIAAPWETREQALVAAVGGSIQQIPGQDIPETLLRFARAENDLRDLFRLHAGAVETYLGPVDLDEVLAASLDDLGPGRQQVTLSLAEDLPDVIADATLLGRILVSLLAGACYRCPAGPPPVLAASSLDGRVEVRITDQGLDGPGGPASMPLRLATDLAEAIGVTLRCEGTQSGGRVVIITLPAAAHSSTGVRTRAIFPDDERQLT